MSVRMTTIAILLGLLLAGGISCSKDADKPEPQRQTTPIISQTDRLPKQSLTIASEQFTVELAFKKAGRTKGMMYRKEIGQNEGMIFIFQNERYRSFWMKNCLIDLDILFLDAQGQIVRTHTMKAPRPNSKLVLYPSDRPAKYAVELAAGTCKRLDIKIGQKIELPKQIKQIIPDAD